MIELPPENVKCPYTGFKTACRKLALDCPKFVQLQGNNPQTGDPISKYGCADQFIPLLLIENSQMQRQTGAAVESFRNEMVKGNAESRQYLEALVYNSKPTNLIEG